MATRSKTVVVDSIKWVHYPKTDVFPEATYFVLDFGAFAAEELGVKGVDGLRIKFPVVREGVMPKGMTLGEGVVPTRGAENVSGGIRTTYLRPGCKLMVDGAALIANRAGGVRINRSVSGGRYAEVSCKATEVKLERAAYAQPTEGIAVF